VEGAHSGSPVRLSVTPILPELPREERLRPHPSAAEGRRPRPQGTRTAGTLGCPHPRDGTGATGGRAYRTDEAFHLHDSQCQPGAEVRPIHVFRSGPNAAVPDVPQWPRWREMYRLPPVPFQGSKSLEAL
jgi:hypothetical protein